MLSLGKIIAAAAVAALATGAVARGEEAHRATPFLPVANEPPPKLFVDPPLAAPLARGVVIVPYRTENFRILPVFGSGAVDVSPRAGHLHVTVDDLPWRWADAGDNDSVVVVGLPPGRHKVHIELATPEHRVIGGQSVTFSVPDPAAPGR